MSYKQSEHDILLCVCESPISHQRKEAGHHFPYLTHCMPHISEGWHFLQCFWNSYINFHPLFPLTPNYSGQLQISSHISMYKPSFLNVIFPAEISPFFICLFYLYNLLSVWCLFCLHNAKTYKIE